jgi:hypothetical protein
LSKSRAKGTAYENIVRDYLKENGFPEAERESFSSALGDIANMPMTIECKSVSRMTLPAWLTQVEKSSQKTGKPGVVVHKRIRQTVSKSYCTMELSTLSSILLELKTLRSAVCEPKA